MDNEQTVSQGQQTSTQAETPASLDDVYKQFNVEAEAELFRAQAPQPQQPQQRQQPEERAPVIPDPALDPDGYKTYEMGRIKDHQALRQTLDGVAGQLNAITQAAARQREEADIKQAVGYIKEKIGGEVDDDLIELALGKEARSDPRFLKLWENRHKNPKAWSAAQEAVANKWANKFAAKVDPQLAENQRAMKQAQKTSATTQSKSGGEWDNLSPGEFQKRWDSLVRGNFM